MFFLKQTLDFLPVVCGEELGEVVVVDVVADAVALKVVCTCLVLLALDEVSVFSSAKS